MMGIFFYKTADIIAIAQIDFSVISVQILHALLPYLDSYLAR